MNKDLLSNIISQEGADNVLENRDVARVVFNLTEFAPQIDQVFSDVYSLCYNGKLTILSLSFIEVRSRTTYTQTDGGGLVLNHRLIDDDLVVNIVSITASI